MTRLFVFLILSGLLLAASCFAQNESAARHLNWKQPPVGCVEDLFPRLPSDEECAHAKAFGNLKEQCDLKADVTSAIQHPDARLPFIDWLNVHTYLDSDKKIEAIYSAAKKYGLPPQFLYGVVNLEGSLADLGIVRDSNNYSCGTGSVNIGQWCRWMSSLSLAEQLKADWPRGIDCSEATLPANIVSAIFKEADFSASVSFPEKGQEEMEEQLLPAVAQAVPDSIILKNLRGKNKIKKLAALRSFTNHCNSIEYSIPVIAYSLLDLFNRYIPTPLKNTQIYTFPETFDRVCKYPYSSKYYPLQPGWLLAYGIHNEGEDLGEALNTFKFRKRLSAMVDFTVIDFPEFFRLGSPRVGKQFGRKAMINIPLVIKRMLPDGARDLLTAEETGVDGK